MNTEAVDLIVSEVPHFKNPALCAAHKKIHDEASFQDKWAWEEIAPKAWVEEMQRNSPAVWHAVNAAQVIHGPGMGAFLCFMGVRLIEMHRVLKPTGSIYLRCDHSVSHYLKLLMDAIFGAEHFRNEIAWCYRGTGGRSNQAFPKRHGVLLFYTRSKNAAFNALYTSYSSEQRHAMQKRKGDASKINRTLERGVPVPDWWDDIPPMSAATQRGFPFQHPVALYERVITASSNEGDMVLDPFYTHPSIIMAAENLGRQWVAISWMGQKDIESEVVECRKKPPERTDI